jgi:hypothetical protein
MQSLSNPKTGLSAFLGKQDRQQAPTHTCLDGFAGGQLHIRDEHALHGLMARGISQGDRFFLNEMRTECFKFFMDADFHMRVPGSQLTDDQLDAVVWSCIACVREHYPHADPSVSTVIVAGLAAPDPLSTKSGNLHIHFPNLIVTSAEACALGAIIANRLPSIPDVVTPWGEAIDEQVYIGNGLRMLGSQKPELCPKRCKGLAGNCEACGNRGRVDAGRAYMVRACYTQERRDADWLAAIRANHALALRSCSVRNETLPLTSTGARPPTVSAAYKKKPKAGSALTGKEPYVLSAIHRSNPRYANLLLTKCTELKAGEMMCADVDGVEAQACPNLITGKHSSSRIWFLFTKQGMRIGCRCKKDTLENRRVKCSEYKSKWMPIDEENMAQLFPNHTNDKIKERAAAISRAGSVMHPATRRVFEHFQTLLHGDPPQSKKRKRETGEPPKRRPPKRKT